MLLIVWLPLVSFHGMTILLEVIEWKMISLINEVVGHALMGLPKYNLLEVELEVFFIYLNITTLNFQLEWD